MFDSIATEAARGLIAGLLLNPLTTATVEAIVDAGDFPTEADGSSPTGRLFELLVDLHRSGVSIRDARLVITRVEAAGLMEQLGGRKGFTANFLDPDAAENATHYARQLRRAAIQRQTRQLASRFAMRAATDEAPETLAAWMRVELDAIESRANETDHVSRIDVEGIALLADIDAARAAGTTPGLLTGIAHLDRTYGGLCDGRLYVIAARPGVGKTSLCQQIGEHIAGQNHGTLFVSLEMTRRELAERYYARGTQLNSKYLGSHALNEGERSRLASAVEASKDVPFWVSEPFGRRATIGAICADARVRCATSDVRLLIVDYCQILEPSSPQQGEYQLVTEATRAFKQLSRELSIPVVLLSQLSRKGDDTKGATRRPKLSDLRSSGSLEQDADAVIFLHDEGAGDIALIVAKMRGGERSEAMLRFHGPTCSFDTPQASDLGNYESHFSEYDEPGF